MALKLPASAIMSALLLAVAALASGASLIVQHHQSKVADERRATALTRGDPEAGHRAFNRRGCGACHALAADLRANGLVGPPLDKLPTRAFLAGQQPNDPDHLIAWVQHPQAMEPGVGMPELGLTDTEARDIAAYLYTLR